MQIEYTPYKPQHRRGFAVVITLLLIAFVVPLLLAMITFIQVETTASSRDLDQLRAHENARLALMIALGVLQRHAGPDQRVSARADILGPRNCQSVLDRDLGHDATRLSTTLARLRRPPIVRAQSKANSE